MTNAASLPQVQCYAVVGQGNVGKTSSIRALTGVARTKQDWFVDFGARGAHACYVQISGLQEDKILPQQFIASVAASGSLYVIVALRFLGMAQRPDAIDYLDAFHAAGWNIAGIFSLGQPIGQWFNSSQGYLPNPAPGTAYQQFPGMPLAGAANTISGAMRAAWGMV